MGVTIVVVTALGTVLAAMSTHSDTRTSQIGAPYFHGSECSKSCRRVGLPRLRNSAYRNWAYVEHRCHYIAQCNGTVTLGVAPCGAAGRRNPWAGPVGGDTGKVRGEGSVPAGVESGAERQLVTDVAH